VIKKIRIPEDRLAVLIGSRGKTRKYLEKKTSTRIHVGEDITVTGEAVNVMTAENVIKAISRGFSPKNAFELLDEEATLGIIDLPKDEKALVRLRSRLIGTRGKSRRNLELLTKTKISIYGKTVGIIGKYENVHLATDGVTRIIKGFSHRNVYEYLEHHQNDLAKD
jgi:ribosomal RNA assembly protein